jgi:hypothetical protein
MTMKKEGATTRLFMVDVVVVGCPCGFVVVVVGVIVLLSSQCDQYTNCLHSNCQQDSVVPGDVVRCCSRTNVSAYALKRFRTL